MKRLFLAGSALFLATAPAFAHAGPHEHGSFLSGLLHPITGADHLLAMVAVGIWAAMIGGRAIAVVPAAFVGTMLMGFLLALAGGTLPFVEPAILASVIVLGLLVAVAVRLPVAASATIVGLFALFHGFAHGGEIGSAAALPYGAGFALSTTLLHVAGLGIGLALASGLGLGTQTGTRLSRVVGGVTALAGLSLMVG